MTSTELIYFQSMESAYIREFTATVLRSVDGYVVLDKSAFYPQGGGQLADTGSLTWKDGSCKIVDTVKKNTIRHIVEDGDNLPAEGAVVTGKLDWDRRYGHMRMHTAQHIISGVVYDLFSARTVGNQIYADRSRIDFQPASFTQEDIARIEQAANAIIASKTPITAYEEARDVLAQRVNQERCNLDRLPAFIHNLRVVEIGSHDLCPCAGTHVKTTDELDPIHIVKKKSKGSGKMRIEYEFVH